jgi:type II secretory ATPase GspE/PulE/Tfp pilus assembly ATPase PilB-like protein
MIFGSKKHVQAGPPWGMGPPVEMVPTVPLQNMAQSLLIEVRQHPGFGLARIFLAEGIDNRAERIMLDFTAQAVAFRYQIDGVWHNLGPLVPYPPPPKHKGPLPLGPPTREMGDLALWVLKKIANLKPEDRRGKQEGKFRTEFAGHKFNTTVVSQGTPAGERVLITFVPIIKGGGVRTLEELGMRDKLRDQVKELIGPGTKGMVVLCSMPQDGLSSLWAGMLRSTDRLMRDFVSLQDQDHPEPEVENVEIIKCNFAEGETPDKRLQKVLLRQPEVLLAPSVPNAATIDGYGKQATVDEPKLSMISTRARDSVDVLLRILAMGVDKELFAKVVTGVVYTRLVRRLCEVCREPIQPTPQLLQRLGIPQGRVSVLFREKQPPPPLPPGVAPPEPPKPKKGEPPPPPLICPACRGLGYKGRTGLFEILMIDDKIRQALLNDPRPETIRQLAKQAGNRTLQEEGILLLAMGGTSLTELQRVLKQ